jgi:hypothetical protein|tara:strand:+ start:893 stop:1732 length:840 start_codon:yes stop_codon:yes gene_type:complete
MTILVPMCGLPRSGSTLLINLVSQHPDVYGSPDSLLSTMILGMQETLNGNINNSQFNSDTSYDLFYNFCRDGAYSWMNTLSNKKFFLDKCRAWNELIDIVKNAFTGTKFIICIRDLRGVYGSLLKIEKKTPLSYNDEYLFGEQDYDYRETNIEEVKVDAVFSNQMIRRNLILIKELLDCNKLDENFLFVRYEDLIENPYRELSIIYDFIGASPFKNNFEDIQQIPFHDAMFLPYGRHKINSKLENRDPWKFNICPTAEDKILGENFWYYEEFYPELLTS